MNIYLLPKNKLGKWSVVLALVMPILFFIGSSFAGSLYQSVPAGGTIPQDIIARPALALTMLAGMACGISAFITGFAAIAKRKDRSLLVLVSTAVGALLILFLSCEIIFPH